VLLAIGVVLSIAGAAVVSAGVLGSNITQLADSEGFLSTPTETFTTQSYALTSPTVGEITVHPAGIQNLPFDIATVRLSVTSTGSDVFVGIAPKTDIDQYLEGVERSEIANLQYFPFKVEYREFHGTAAQTPPAQQSFWVESASGPGTQEVQWRVAPGDWGVVVMNADASPNITVDLQTAVRSDLIAPIGTLIITIGLVLLILGIAMIIGGAIVLSRQVSSTQASLS
jgi:hypothetical protein